MQTDLQQINWYPLIGWIAGAAWGLLLLLGGFVLNRLARGADELGVTVKEINKNNASEHKQITEALSMLMTRIAVTEARVERLEAAAHASRIRK